jgi:osmotically-inducible protein OsmY
MKPNKLVIVNAIVIACTMLLGGCTAAVVGTAAIVAIDIAHDRRTAGNYIDDNTVELTLRQRFLKDPQIRANTHVSVTSMNGVVLLTGEVPNEQLRELVLSQTRDLSDVRQVLDEMRIAGKSTVGSRMNDTWITSKVKSQLVSKISVEANRTKVVTEYGNVYLMGLVTREEGDIAAQTARNVAGVSRVVKVFEYIE